MAAQHSNVDSVGATRLYGPPLILARAVWIVLAFTALALAVVAIPEQFAQMRTVCSVPPCPSGQITPTFAAALREIGLSPGARAFIVAACQILVVVAFGIVAAIIFSRRSDDWMAIFISLVLITLAVVDEVIYPATKFEPPLRWPAMFVEAFLMAALVIAFYLFPDGRFVPRWTRVLGLIWIVWIGGSYLFPNAPFSVLRWSAISFLFFRLAWYSSGLIAQISRYRSVSNALQRQQTKWVVFGLTITVVVAFAMELVPVMVPALGGSSATGVLYRLIRLPVYVLFLLLIPFSIGVSILRHRLWDVDILINRTLVYTTLTVFLALIYYGSITLLQTVFRAVTGEKSAIAVIISTLGIAALLNPLRQGIQTFIDRYFYRRKYNASQVLAALSTTVRDEVDLERLTAALLRVVNETMQPAQASLWLREHQIHHTRSGSHVDHD